MKRPIAENAYYEEIRRSIVLGEYRPNQRLIETDLAGDLGISRTPIREALQRLATDGLILRTRHGWVVYEHSADEIRQIYEIRSALESHAARLATERLEGPDRDRFLTLSKEAQSRTGLTTRELVESNERFHRLVLEVAGNKQLAKLSERTSQFYFNYHLAASYTTEELTTSRRQHVEIANAILNGEADLAARIVRDHLETALEVGLSKLARSIVSER